MVKNNTGNKIYFILFMLQLSILFACNFASVINFQEPHGDLVYHIKSLEAWKNAKSPKDLPLFNKEYFWNGIPYPPAFHVIIVVLSMMLFSSPIVILKILDLLLPLGILSSTFYLVYKKSDIYTALLTVCFLSSGIAFWDRATQVIPQAVIVLLYPTAVYLFLENKDTLFVIVGTLLIYIHSFYTALLLSSLFVYCIINKHGKRKFRLFKKIFLISLPLIILFFYHSPSLGVGGSQIDSFQTRYTRIFPFYNIMYLGPVLFIFSIIGLVHLVFKKKTDLENILILWVVGLIPIVFFLPERFLTLVAQPLAIISAITIRDHAVTERLKWFFLLVIYLISLLYLYELCAEAGLFRSHISALTYFPRWAIFTKKFPFISF